MPIFVNFMLKRFTGNYSVSQAAAQKQLKIREELSRKEKNVSIILVCYSPFIKLCIQMCKDRFIRYYLPETLLWRLTCLSTSPLFPPNHLNNKIAVFAVWCYYCSIMMNISGNSSKTVQLSWLNLQIRCWKKITSNYMIDMKTAFCRIL